MTYNTDPSLRFDRQQPADLTADQWRQGQVLLRDSLVGETGLTLEQANRVTRTGDPEMFAAVRIDPDRDVQDGRLHPNQSFADGLVVTAWDRDEMVGWAYAANNTSGPNEQIRQGKMASIIKRHNWIREIAVAPEHRRKNTATIMTALILSQRIWLQPTAVYLLAGDAAGSPLSGKLVTDGGFKPDGEFELNERTGLYQQRLQVGTGAFYKKLRRRPGAALAIDQAEAALQA